jgi:hypothetical protein
VKEYVMEWAVEVEIRVAVVLEPDSEFAVEQVPLWYAAEEVETVVCVGLGLEPGFVEEQVSPWKVDGRALGRCVGMGACAVLGLENRFAKSETEEPCGRDGVALESSAGVGRDVVGGLADGLGEQD